MIRLAALSSMGSSGELGTAVQSKHRNCAKHTKLEMPEAAPRPEGLSQAEARRRHCGPGSQNRQRRPPSFQPLRKREQKDPSPVPKGRFSKAVLKVVRFKVSRRSSKGSPSKRESMLPSPN